MVPAPPPTSGGPSVPVAITARAAMPRRPVSVRYPAGDLGPLLYEEGTEGPLLALAPTRGRPVSRLYPSGFPIALRSPPAPGAGGDAFTIDASGTWTVFGSMPMVRGKKWPATGTLTIAGAAAIAFGNDPELVHGPPPAPAPPAVADWAPGSAESKRKRLRSQFKAPPERDRDEVRRELLALMDAAEQRLHEKHQGPQSAELVSTMYQARQAGPQQMLSALEQGLWLLTPAEREQVAAVREERRQARRKRNRQLALLLAMMD